MPDNEFSRADDGDKETYVSPLGEKIQPSHIFMDPDNIIHIRMIPTQLAPDRTQYKPYSPLFMFPYNVAVEVTIPLKDKYIVDIATDASFVVLTPDGIAYIADQLATALDKMHDEFRARDRKF